MTLFQKTLITAVLAASAGTGLYQARQAAALSAENRALAAGQAALTRDIEREQSERDALARRLAALPASAGRASTPAAELLKLRAELAALRADKQDATQSEARSWLEKARRLKQRLEQTPEAKIPELRLLTDKNWLMVALDFDLNDESQVRQAFSRLRNMAELAAGNQMQAAMKKYCEAHPGGYATDLAQLKPYLDPPLEDAILERYAIQTSASARNLQLGDDWIILLKTPTDPDHDLQVGVGSRGSGSTSFPTESKRALEPVLQAYQAANPGKSPEHLAQLAPFASTAEQQAALQKEIALEKARGQ
jgi:hypothetical protein